MTPRQIGILMIIVGFLFAGMAILSLGSWGSYFLAWGGLCCELIALAYIIPSFLESWRNHRARSIAK